MYRSPGMSPICAVRAVGAGAGNTDRDAGEYPEGLNETANLLKHVASGTRGCHRKKEDLVKRKLNRRYQPRLGWTRGRGGRTGEGRDDCPTGGIQLRV